MSAFMHSIAVMQRASLPSLIKRMLNAIHSPGVRHVTLSIVRMGLISRIRDQSLDDMTACSLQLQIARFYVV